MVHPTGGGQTEICGATAGAARRWPDGDHDDAGVTAGMPASPAGGTISTIAIAIRQAISGNYGHPETSPSPRG